MKDLAKCYLGDEVGASSATAIYDEFGGQPALTHRAICRIHGNAGDVGMTLNEMRRYDDDDFLMFQTRMCNLLGSAGAGLLLEEEDLPKPDARYFYRVGMCVGEADGLSRITQIKNPEGFFHRVLTQISEKKQSGK